MKTKRYRTPKRKDYITYDDLEQLGFGSWLKDNAGNLIQGAAGTAMMFLPVPGARVAGANMLASAGTGFANTAAEGRAKDAQEENIALQNEIAKGKALNNNVNTPSQSSPTSFVPTMAYGGRMWKKRLPKYQMGGPQDSLGKNTIPVPEAYKVRFRGKEEPVEIGVNLYSRLNKAQEMDEAFKNYYRTTYADKLAGIPEGTDAEKYAYIQEAIAKGESFPEVSYTSMAKDLGYTDEDMQEFFKDINQYSLAGYGIGNNEGRITNVQDIIYGGRSAFAPKFMTIDEMIPTKEKPVQWGEARDIPFNLPAGKKFENGGTINYSGQPHAGPDGGVPVDGMGNPNPMNPVALVEEGEVSFNDGNAPYVFSDKLLFDKDTSFAKRAKKIQSRYKLRMKDGKITDSISRNGYEREMKELIDMQEAHRTMEGLGNEEYEGLPIGENGIRIKPSKRGTFTKAAKERGMGVQEFARKVMANKDEYSPAIVKKANFAKNASKWKKEYGGDLPAYDGENLTQYITPLPGKVNVGIDIPPPPNIIPGTSSSIEYTPYEGMHWATAAVPAAISSLSNLYMANRADRYTPTKLDLPKQVAERISLEGERQRLKEEANLARAINKRRLLESGASKGQMMSGSIASNTGVQRNLNEGLVQLGTTEALTNLENRKEANRLNYESELQEQIYNSGVEANTNALVDQYLMNAFTAPLLGMKDYMSSRTDAAKLQMSQPNQQLMWKTDYSKPWWKNRRTLTKRDTNTGQNFKLWLEDLMDTQEYQNLNNSR